MKSKTAPCATCGKPVIVRNIHDTRRNLPIYCSRVCASNARYANKRYQESPPHQRLTPQELLERKLV